MWQRRGHHSPGPAARPRLCILVRTAQLFRSIFILIIIRKAIDGSGMTELAHGRSTMQQTDRPAAVQPTSIPAQWRWLGARPRTTTSMSHAPCPTWFACNPSHTTPVASAQPASIPAGGCTGGPAGGHSGCAAVQPAVRRHALRRGPCCRTPTTTSCTIQPLIIRPCLCPFHQCCVRLAVRALRRPGPADWTAARSSTGSSRISPTSLHRAGASTLWFSTPTCSPAHHA